MSDQLTHAIDISPGDSATVPNPNLVTVNFADWQSKPYLVPGTPNGAEEVNFLLSFVFDGATSLEVMVEHAAPAAPGTVPSAWYPMGRIDSTSQVFNDTAFIVPGNLEVGQTEIDLNFRLKAGHFVRLTARAIAPGAATELVCKVTAGGGGSRA